MTTALKVHRNDVYRSLERLSARGLVETTLEKPARYVATDPRKVFDAELEGRLATLETMKTSRSLMGHLLQVVAMVRCGIGAPIVQSFCERCPAYTEAVPRRPLG